MTRPPQRCSPQSRTRNRSRSSTRAINPRCQLEFLSMTSRRRPHVDQPPRVTDRPTSKGDQTDFAATRWTPSLATSTLDRHWQDELDHLVRQARAQGASWTKLALVLGMSPQGGPPEVPGHRPRPGVSTHIDASTDQRRLFGEQWTTKRRQARRPLKRLFSPSGARTASQASS